MRNREIRAFTLERDVVHAIERKVPSGERSRFVNQAIKHALQGHDQTPALSAMMILLALTMQVAILATGA